MLIPILVLIGAVLTCGSCLLVLHMKLRSKDSGTLNSGLPELQINDKEEVSIGCPGSEIISNPDGSYTHVDNATGIATLITMPSPNVIFDQDTGHTTYDDGYGNIVIIDSTGNFIESFDLDMAKDNIVLEKRMRDLLRRWMMEQDLEPNQTIAEMTNGELITVTVGPPV